MYTVPVEFGQDCVSVFVLHFGDVTFPMWALFVSLWPECPSAHRIGFGLGQLWRGSHPLVWNLGGDWFGDGRSAVSV